MFQLKQKNNFLLKSFLTMLFLFIPRLLTAQGYDDSFELKNKLKIELQYSDYEEYQYPEALLLKYGVNNNQKNASYFINFPERRALIKYSRLIGESTALSGKYQYSDIKEDAKQHLFEVKATKLLWNGITGIINLQVNNDTRGFNAYQFGAGASYELSPITSFESDLQFYTRGSNAVPIGGWMNTLNFRFKYRQVLTLSTAALMEYSFYNTQGEKIGFNSHSIAFWLSQFLPTETAVHLNLRYYYNTAGISSLSPSLEAAQYIDWDTVIRLKYRYYKNHSSNVNLGEEGVVIPDGLESNSLSAQINHDFSTSLLGYLKYRYYFSNQNVKMHTIMIGFVYSY